MNFPTNRSEILPYVFSGWRLIVILAIVLIIFGMFLAHSCSNYFAGRDIGKARANVDAALNAVNGAKGTVANDKTDEALALQNVNAAVQDVISASNATDQAKAEANAAVANYIAQKAAHLPTGTTEKDLDDKLKALGE